jgi:hypothetical protein
MPTDKAYRFMADSGGGALAARRRVAQREWRPRSEIDEPMESTSAQLSPSHCGGHPGRLRQTAGRIDLIPVEGTALVVLATRRAGSDLGETISPAELRGRRILTDGRRPSFQESARLTDTAVPADAERIERPSTPPPARFRLAGTRTFYSAMKILDQPSSPTSAR